MSHTRRAAIVGLCEVLLGAGGCSPREQSSGGTSTAASAIPDGAARRTDSDSTAQGGVDAKAGTMSQASCEDARGAIERRQFVGWMGLPATCSPVELFGIPADDQWGARLLGKASARQRLLDLAGYHRPLVSVREERVVLFDGAYPELDGGWDALRADLGDPEQRLDFEEGTITVAAGEWLYPARGIAVYVSSDASKVYHVAVFAPTTAQDFHERLRPSYAQTRVPSRR